MNPLNPFHPLTAPWIIHPRFICMNAYASVVVDNFFDLSSIGWSAEACFRSISKLMHSGYESTGRINATATQATSA